MKKKRSIFWTEAGITAVPEFIREELNEMVDPSTDGAGWLRFGSGRHSVVYEHIVKDGLVLKFLAGEDQGYPYMTQPPMSEVFVMNGFGPDPRIPELYAWGNDFLLMELVSEPPLESLGFDFMHFEPVITPQIESFIREMVDHGFIPSGLNKEDIRFDPRTEKVRFLDFNHYSRLLGRHTRREKQQWAEQAMADYRQNMRFSFGWTNKSNE